MDVQDDETRQPQDPRAGPRRSRGSRAEVVDEAARSPSAAARSSSGTPRTELHVDDRPRLELRLLQLQAEALDRRGEPSSRYRPYSTSRG